MSINQYMKKRITTLAKIFITISLFMVAHALFYPNKFSLIIAIFGFMLALVFTVVYGVYKD